MARADSPDAPAGAPPGFAMRHRAREVRTGGVGTLGDDSEARAAQIGQRGGERFEFRVGRVPLRESAEMIARRSPELSAAASERCPSFTVAARTPGGTGLFDRRGRRVHDGGELLDQILGDDRRLRRETSTRICAD